MTYRAAVTLKRASAAWRRLATSPMDSPNLTRRKFARMASLKRWSLNCSIQTQGGMHWLYSACQTLIRRKTLVKQAQPMDC